MTSIFISYAREDQAVALEIYNVLMGENYSVWMDAKNLLPGQDWQTEIEKSIRQSDIFLACLSNHAVNKTGYAQAELKKALTVADLMPEGKIYIIPIRLDDCPVPSKLRDFHWLNYFEENSTASLLEAIQRKVNSAELLKKTIQAFLLQNSPEALKERFADLPPAEIIQTLLAIAKHDDELRSVRSRAVRGMALLNGLDQAAWLELLPTASTELLAEWLTTWGDENDTTILSPEHIQLLFASKRLPKSTSGLGTVVRKWIKRGAGYNSAAFLPGSTYPVWEVKYDCVRSIIALDDADSLFMLAAFSTMSYWKARSRMIEYIESRYSAGNLSAEENRLALEILERFVNDGKTEAKTPTMRKARQALQKMSMSAEKDKIEATIRSLEDLKAQGLMSAEQVDASIIALRDKLATYEAKLDGNGSLAQHGETAIGAQGISASRDVTGSILNTGTLNLFFERYQSPAGRAQLSKDDFEHILKEYLTWVVKAYGKARLYGLESMRATHQEPRRQLGDVFVPLTLQRFSSPKRDEIEALADNFKGDPHASQRAYLRAVEKRRTGGDEISLKSLLTNKSHLALIGGAGCGKSTLTAYLAASLAQAALDGEKCPFDLPQDRDQLIPLVIPLRYFHEYQRLCIQSPQEMLKNPRTGKLAGFIPWYLMRRSPALELSQDFFDRLLLGGSCLLMLDGLDEVVSRAERGQVRAQVEAIANDIYPNNMLLITARESGYREDAVFGDDFARLDVQPLTDAQIKQLARNWCEQLYPEAAAAQTDEIMLSIRNINWRYENQELPRLISTPLMTTMVVSVKWGENELPRERAKLYEAAVKVILQAQYLENDDAQKELINWGGEWEEQRDWLSFLALAMHGGGRNGAAIPEERVREILLSYPGMQPVRLNSFIQAVRHRGGLFEERAELFQFAHLTFQEFLAARLLAKQRTKSFQTLAALVDDSWWREVFLLAYGYAKTDWPAFAGDYLNWLSTLDTNDSIRLAGLELAASALLEIERPDAQAHQKQAHLLCAAFEKPNQHTSVSLRVRAGNTLAALGDPRFDLEHWSLPKDENFGFLHIPASTFIMGSDDKLDNEKPQHELNISYDYWLAKYPVTVTQYRIFINQSGYKTQYKDSMRGIPNHPVVNVTWYDALAYCRWLDTQLKEWTRQTATLNQLAHHNQQSMAYRLVQDHLSVTLPSEAEWEKAARGMYGRVYPWGDNADPKRANYDDTSIGTTNTTGSFLSGASEYGLLDISGNVWEWTRSLFKKYPYQPDDGREDLSETGDARVLRGGSFSNYRDDARCAYRGVYIPDVFDLSLGFRVALSPFLR